MPTCPNAYWQLRMRPTGGAWTALLVYAEPGADGPVTFPPPYDVGFTLLVYADSRTAPFAVDLPDGSRIRLTNQQGAILTYTPTPGERVGGVVTVPPLLERDGPPELIPDLRNLAAESQIRASYAAGTPLWLWGPGTASQPRAEMQRLAGIVTRNPALVKHVPDTGDVRLAGPPVVECAGVPATTQPSPPRAGLSGLQIAGIGIGLAAALGALVWIARR